MPTLFQRRRFCRQPPSRCQQFLGRQAVARIAPVKRDLRSALAQQSGQAVGLSLRNDWVHASGADEDNRCSQIGRRIGLDRHHRTEQNGSRQRAWVQQHHRGGDVRAIGIAHRDNARGIEMIFGSGGLYELRKLARAKDHILLVEDAFPQAPEEARHPIFQDFSARAENGCARRQRLSQRDQVGFIAAGSMEREHGGFRICVRSRNETVDEAQFHYHHSVRGMSSVERFVDETPGQPAVRGFLHRPGLAAHEPEAAPIEGDALVLTHGAGSNCGAPLLVAIAEAFAEAGIMVLRCDLPFRQARPHGPPFGNGAQDRAGLRRAVEAVRQIAHGQTVRVFLGGHSYGGRQASMLVSEDAAIADALLLLSYPLHPPDKPQQLRTAHFEKLRTPALFIHGSRDPFGSLDEMRAALRLIPARTELVAIENAGHDLARGRQDVARQALAALTEFVEQNRKHGDPSH